MRRERKNIWKDTNKHFKGHERDCFSQGVQSHASGSTTAENLSAASTGTLSTLSAAPTLPPTLLGLLGVPSPATSWGSRVDQKQAQKTSPRSGRGCPQTGALEPPSGNPETGFQEAAWWVVRAERQKSFRTLPQGLPGGSMVKNPPAKAEDPGSVPCLGGPHMPRGN